MLTWLWRLLIVGRPEKPGLAALRARVEIVEKLLETFTSEVREQRARITTLRREKKAAEDAPQETIATEEAPPVPPRRPVGTAHLARRFRIGG